MNACVPLHCVSLSFEHGEISVIPAPHVEHNEQFLPVGLQCFRLHVQLLLFDGGGRSVQLEFDPHGDEEQALKSRGKIIN